MKFPNPTKLFTWLLIVAGVVFLLFPLGIDSYAHWLQNQAYSAAHEQTISCRANLALEAMHNLPAWQVEHYLDSSCGVLPKYDDFSYHSTNGILSAYNWVAQKVTFIPL